MREIKFRGLATSNCQEIYGTTYEDGKIDGTEVIEWSVGQFLNIQDINGRDLYENDVVKTSSGRVVIVRSDDGTLAGLIAAFHVMNEEQPWEIIGSFRPLQVQAPE